MKYTVENISLKGLLSNPPLFRHLVQPLVGRLEAHFYQILDKDQVKVLA